MRTKILDVPIAIHIEIKQVLKRAQIKFSIKKIILIFLMFKLNFIGILVKLNGLKQPKNISFFILLYSPIFENLEILVILSYGSYGSYDVVKKVSNRHICRMSYHKFMMLYIFGNNTWKSNYLITLMFDQLYFFAL